MRKLPKGVRRVFRLRRQVEKQVADEVDREIAFHLESRIEELMEQGVPLSDAERQAKAEFGDIERARIGLRGQSQRRERRVRATELTHDLLNDLRYGWRKLWESPSFAMVAILTLAFGIGANTAIFSVVNAVLLRPLPYVQPDRIVRVWEIRPDGHDHNVVSRGNFLDWRDMAQSFSELGAHSSTYSVGLNPAGANPIRIPTATATPGVFRTLGSTPVLGRTFTREEGRPGGSPVAIISHRLWQTMYGGDRGMVGTEIVIDDVSRTVVGVMPAGFDFPDADVDLWTPWVLGEDDRQNRRSHNLQVIARLEDEVTVSQARAEMDALALRIADAHPRFMTGWGVNVLPFRADMVSNVRPLLMLLSGVVAAVLLIACVNLANLLLARALQREREVAVRLALGAGRGRLLRQFLTEAALVAAAGGTLGFLMNLWGIDLFVALAPNDIPLLDNVRVDLPVHLFALGITLLATLAFGLIPALRATATDPQRTLRDSDERGGGARHQRFRAGLLVIEVALAVALLIGAGLLLRSLQQLQRVDYGYNPNDLHATRVSLPGARYESNRQQVEFFRSLAERVAALPGIESAAGTSDEPGGGMAMTFSFAIENRPNPGPSGREDPVPLRIVTPDFFSTMQIPVRSGRVLDRRDGTDAPPTIVINETLARRLWPDEDPVGQRISFQRDVEEWWEIVGVVGDTRLYETDETAGPALYMTYSQKRWSWMNWMVLLLRQQPGVALPIDAVRHTIQSADPALPLGQIESVVDKYAAGEARRTFAASLLVAFAALALLLGIIGIYGVLSYSVAQRTREIGVRIALGAPRSSVAGAVVGQAILVSGAGVVIGLVTAIALSRFMLSLVYGIAALDVTTYVAVPILVLTVTALAAYIPANRAINVDPATSLRVE